MKTLEDLHFPQYPGRPVKGECYNSTSCIAIIVNNRCDTTSFFLYTSPSLRQPTAPVTCKVAFGTGLSVGFYSMHTEYSQEKDLKEYPTPEGKNIKLKNIYTDR